MVAQPVTMATLTSYLLKYLAKIDGIHFFTIKSSLCHQINITALLSIKFYTNLVGCYGSTTRNYGNMTSYKEKNPLKTDFSIKSSLCHQINITTLLNIIFFTNSVRCHGGTTRNYDNIDIIFTKISTKNRWKTFFTINSSMCHRINITTLLSIKFYINLVGCHGSVTTRSGNEPSMGLYSEKSLILVVK